MLALRGLHRDLRPYAEAAHQLASRYGLTPQVTSVFRSWSEQQALRRRYEKCLREGKYPWHPECRWPANKPGDSSHNYGLSWDSWVPADQFPLWTAIREYIGFHVPAHDRIHAELPNWRSFVK